MNNTTNLLGRFQAIDSFFISPDNLYGIIGDIIDGKVQPGAFAYIKLNSMMHLTAKIDEVKEIQLSGEGGQHKLILFKEPEEDLNSILYAMNVSSEIIEIYDSGED